MVQQTREQLRASNPKSSVWVGASAGTGKTFVLSNRVLRLMLVGNRPDKILCLTYTNTAAAEMAIRVNERLSEWISLNDQSLTQELNDVLGTRPSKDQIILARKLFAQVLDVPGGLKIQTIHSFCQSLLGRFPIEANVSPNFDLLDDITINEHLRKSQDDMLQKIDEGSNDELKNALNYLSGMLAEDTFSQLMKGLTNERGGIEQLIERNSRSFNTVNERLKELLGFQNDDSRETILSAACAEINFDTFALLQTADIQLNTTKRYSENGVKIKDWINNPDERVNKFDIYKTAFLKADGDIKSDGFLLNTKSIENFPESLEVIHKEADRLLFINERLKLHTLYENSVSILRLGFELIETYNKRKRVRNVVDYDDLIGKVSSLFKNVSASWILFKLDEGIDHILIDEAQDTNPDQWYVIRKIAQEFFSGLGTRNEDMQEDNPRTIFAVGDVKQSIYSFQKAKPQEFVDNKEYFKDQAADVGLDFVEVPMNLSFRSTSAVLSVVDKVFDPEEYRRAISFKYDEIIHDTYRQGDPGLIEIWDPVLPEESEEIEGWSPPVIQKSAHDPKQKLAEKIADQIEDWIKRGEILASKGRPVTAGDILILVQKRKDFVHFMIRALKKRGVNVAGLDQMVLTDQLAVMDLMAVANFTLLPSDDLTLAVVLKSPFIGMSEEDLFDLAHKRDKGKSLWSVLLKRKGERDSFVEAVKYLTRLTNYADFHPPFEFFSNLLGPMQGREKLNARLGEQINDPVDEFLNQAMKYEQNNISSMQGFLSWIERGDIKVKREMEQGGDMVRIMTVHGAKGLQAPIVFLPDTSSPNTMQESLFWYTESRNRSLLWVKNRDTRVGPGKIAYENRKADIEDENKRLLYVAMTRAEDRLYVSGWENKRGNNLGDNSWYDLIRTAVQEMDGTEEIQDGEETILRRHHGEVTVDIVPVVEVKESEEVALPGWAKSIPGAEPVPSKPLSPSRLDEKEEVVRSPLKIAEQMRKDKTKYHRGRIIHKLLETLPDIEDDKRAGAMERYLSQDAHELHTNDITQISDEVTAILNNPDLEGLFGPGSRSEVPIVGQVGSFSLSGQVDRLAVTDTEILIVDYKSNRPPPENADKTPLIYKRQMAAYRAVLKKIYPDKRVRSFLLWTDIGSLMEIPDEILNKINF